MESELLWGRDNLSRAVQSHTHRCPGPGSTASWVKGAKREKNLSAFWPHRRQNKEPTHCVLCVPSIGYCHTTPLSHNVRNPLLSSSASQTSAPGRRVAPTEDVKAVKLGSLARIVEEIRRVGVGDVAELLKGVEYVLRRVVVDVR